MRYYRLGQLIRTAETHRAAQRLTRRGWQRITAAQHRALWRQRDMARIASYRKPQPAPPMAQPRVNAFDWGIKH